MKANSRHRLRDGFVRQYISPGGKIRGKAYKPLGSKCQKQLAVEPGFGTLLVMLRQMTQLRNGLEPFEHKLYLPPYSIPLKNFPSVKPLLGKRGKHNNIFCHLERDRLNFLLFS